MKLEEWSSLLAALGSLLWPILVISLLIANRKHVGTILEVATDRVKRGAGFTVVGITVGEAVGQLQVPQEGDLVTDDHLALIHRSWRVPDRDGEFGSPMYQIHIIVFGPSQALRRIEYVIYRLEDSYPQSVRQGGSLETNFELKELANGYSLLRAEVYIKGQKEPVRLARFIDLTDQSPKLKGTYQNMAKR